MADAIAPLEQMARTDPTVAALARLKAVALQAAEDPTWADGAPRLDGRPVEGGAPLLQGITLTINTSRLRRLLRDLAAVLHTAGRTETDQLSRLFGSSDFDPLQMLHASLTQDDDRLRAAADAADVDATRLAVVAHDATLPLLLACGRRAGETVSLRTWTHGYCPVCAAWPTLAEVRGLARDLILRCGRCASEWPFEHRRCPYCGQRSERSQTYFAAEQEREMRRAVTCDRCHGYLKTQATLGPLEPGEILLRDVESLELDLVALDHGYRRPETPGWVLSLRVEPVVGRRGGWLRRP